MRILLALLLACVLYASAQAQDGRYRLQVGDTLEISVLQDPNLKRQVRVLPDGRISFPLTKGPLRAAGQTPEQIETALKKELQPHFKTDLDVEVIVLGVAAEELGTIYVTGEVRNPGQFPIREPVTLMQAIALAGGFDRFAAKHSIKVHRKRKGRDFYHSFNYYNFAAGRDEAGNITLRDGDVVIVPERGIFGFLFELFE